MSDDGSGSPRGEERSRPKEVLPVEWLQRNHLDEVFEVLANRWRRCALYYLAEMPGMVAERSQVVEAIRYAEAAERDPADVPSSDSVALELHHDHLPRLEDVGVIEYDRRQGTVRYHGRPSVEEWLDHAYYKETGELK